MYTVQYEIEKAGGKKTSLSFLKEWRDFKKPERFRR